MQRNSPQYKRLKAAHELSLSPGWLEYLEEILVRDAQAELPPLDSLDACIATARAQGKRDYAKHLLARVKREAREFTSASVTPGEEEYVSADEMLDQSSDQTGDTAT